VWPTEPAKAGWSFNKWRKTRIPKELRPNSRRQQNVHALAVVPAAAEVLADVADAGVVDAAGQAAVAPAEVVDPAAEAVAVDKAEAAVRAAKAASAAAEAGKARVVIATVDAAMVAASSSRT
jgi:hypothetical protein